MELRLPHEDGLKQDQIPKDMPAAMGTAGADRDTRNPGQTRPFGAVGGQTETAPLQLAGPGDTRIARAVTERRDAAGEAVDQQVFIRPADPGVSRLG